MPEYRGNHPFEQWRHDFESLDWSRGYDRDELMKRFPNVPREHWNNYPSGHRFTSFNDFWNYQGTSTRTPGQERGSR